MRYRHESTPQPPGTKVSVSDMDVTSNFIMNKPAIRSRSTNDEVTPNFHVRRAKGEVFNNHFSSLKTRFEANDNFTYNVQRKSDGKVWPTTTSNGYFLTDLFVNAPLRFPEVSLDVEALAAKARIDCLGNINATDLDSLNFAAEWSKTRRLHRDLGNAILKVFTEGAKHRRVKSKFKRTPILGSDGQPLLNRKGKPIYKYLHEPGYDYGQGSLSRAKAMSNVYLGGRYGLMPLIHDIDSAWKVLSKSRPRRNTARGTGTLQGSSYGKHIEGFWGNPWEIQLTTTRTFTCRYGILYESSFAGSAAANLGFSRPLSSVWESLPWSFVADWFVDIGGWLDAIQPAFAGKNLSAWETLHETVVHTASIMDSRVHEDGSQRITSTWSGGLISVNELTTRKPWWPTTPKYPALGQGFNQLRALDFANLVIQRANAKY